MTQEQIDLINKVVWFIPFKNKRNTFRNFLNAIVESINIIQSQNQQIIDINNQITGLTQHIVNQNQQITDLTQHSVNQNQQIIDINNQITGLTQHIANQNQQITDLTQHSINQNQQIIDINNQITGLTQHIANQNQQITDLTQHSINQNQQITDLTQHAINQNQQITDLTQHSINQNQHITNLAQHSINQNQQITDLTQHAINQNQQITDLTQHAINQSQQITDLTQHIANQNQHIIELIKRIKVYENLSPNDNINNLPFIRIYNDDTEENLKNRKIVEEVLIENTANQSRYDLHNYFIENRKRAIDKWLFYFDVYEKHFSRFRGKDINLLEIGVQNGGSLQMWKYYFTYKYPNAKVNLYGIDIDEKVKSLEDDENDIKIFIGSQSDREFLQKIKNEIPKLDILIDDGGHTMEQQIVTFEEMYEHVKDNGVYLCEDTHTSYFSHFGGGYHNQNTFIEYAKNLIDDLHSYWFEENIPINSLNIVNTTQSINFYDSMVFFEKKIRNPKYNSLCGRAQIGKCTVIDF